MVRAVMVREDYLVLSPADVVVMTSDSAELARRFVMARKADLPGLRIEKHTLTLTVEAIYTPRIAKPARSAA